MAKQGIYYGNIHPVIRQISNQAGWALCIGAGTSLPVFPSWSQLVKRLISRDVGLKTSEDISESLNAVYQADAIIQAARDRLNINSEAFANTLSEELYRDVKSRLSRDEWKIFSSLIFSHSGYGKSPAWNSYLEIVENKLPECSAYELSQSIVDVLDTELAPSAILSFNAEPFLPSIVNAIWRRKLAQKFGPNIPKGQIRKKLDLVTQTISMRRNDRLPVYFLHGLLPAPGNKRSRDIAGKGHGLVFSESDYLQLANSVFSWQAASFTEVCSSKSVVFVGVSLSDPNMRRWLSWVHSNRKDELSFSQDFTGDSTIHYWITLRPVSHLERRWQESIVSHLGVRIIWVKEWGQLGKAFRHMLGI